MLDVMPSPRRRSLLDHFSVIKDARQSCKVMYPLREVILLVVCGTIADCDDYDDIAEWGAAHLDFLRTMSEFHYGIPCEDWLRVIMNRIDPALFSACFEAWVAERWPQVSSLVALDGKTSRRSHDQATGRRALHLVSAFATNRHLGLGRRRSRRSRMRSSPFRPCSRALRWKAPSSPSTPWAAIQRLRRAFSTPRPTTFWP